MRSFLSLLAVALLAACASPAGPGGRRLVVTPQAPPALLRLLATAVPYGASDVKRLELSLLRLDGSAESPVADPVTLTGSPFSQRVTFGNLGAGLTYRVRARAYDQATGGALVSRDDAFADLNVPYDDAPLQLSLTVGLRDRPFEGTGAVSGVSVEAGGLVPDAGGLAAP